MKRRLFVAISSFQGLETELSQLLKKLKIGFDQKEIDIKWTLLENLHVTLVFIGEVPADALEPLKEKIQDVCLKHSPFNLKVENISGFPDPAAARVTYLGVQRSQKILDLQSDLEQALGLKADFEYSPHLTVGRLRNPKSIKDAISPFSRKKFGKVEITDVVLYESHQSGPYPIYKPLARFKLDCA